MGSRNVSYMDFSFPFFSHNPAIDWPSSLSWFQVCLCCSLCTSWGSAYSSQGLHATGHILVFSYTGCILFYGTSEVLLMKILSYKFQPPWDLEVGKRFIIHYTYGCDYNLKVSDFNALLSKKEQKETKFMSCYCSIFFCGSIYRSFPFSPCSSVRIYPWNCFNLLLYSRGNWHMGKSENGVLIRDCISVVLRQETSLCLLQEFLKVWYVLSVH